MNIFTKIRANQRRIIGSQCYLLERGGARKKKFKLCLRWRCSRIFLLPFPSPPSKKKKVLQAFRVARLFKIFLFVLLSGCYENIIISIDIGKKCVLTCSCGNQSQNWTLSKWKQGKKLQAIYSPKRSRIQTRKKIHKERIFEKVPRKAIFSWKLFPWMHLL